MKHLAVLLALTCAPVAAQDFSQGSEAKSWNLAAEIPARFEAMVVDMLAEMTGDDSNACGAHRQLGLRRSADGQLIFPNKNNQPVFTGAAVDLHPFCGKLVEVDGLMIDDPDLGVRNVYQVQKIREQGATDWVTANRWTAEWDQAHPDASGKGPWYRRDPAILTQIEAHGYLGQGETWQEAWDATQ